MIFSGGKKVSRKQIFMVRTFCTTCIVYTQPPGKTERRFWAEFSAHNSCIWAGYPILYCTRPFRCFSVHMFTDSAYFPTTCTDFAYFPLILRWSCLAGQHATAILPRIFFLSSILPLLWPICPDAPFSTSSPRCAGSAASWRAAPTTPGGTRSSLTRGPSSPPRRWRSDRAGGWPGRSA